jgi:putative Mn2+ efflux pump MntP
MYPLAAIFDLGLDSLLAGLALGSRSLSWRDRLRFAMIFGLCDATANLCGSVWQHPFPEPPALAIYILCALSLCFAARYSRSLLYALPVLLSIDNLFSGGPATMAPLLGFSSAAMALLGLTVAAACRRMFFERAEAM